MWHMKNQNNLHLDQLIQSTITIEVAYAASNLAATQSVIKLEIERGSNIQEAINQSGILFKYPNISLTNNQVGIFGQIQNLATIVKNGDRVEIYRNLQHEPNAIRILRSKNLD